MVQISVIGASGAVGEQILAALAAAQEDGRIEVGDVRAFASRACRVADVAFGERRIEVEQLSAVEGWAGLTFLCAPPAVGARLAGAIVSGGALVVDVGGATDLPLYLPGRPPDLAEVVRRGGLRTPSGAGWLLASVIGPLREAGATGVSGVLALPATAAGRAGMEELGAQVVATFNGREAPHRVFPEGLAFDLLPEGGPPDEWSARELQAAAEVEALVGLPADRVGVSLCTGSVFAGIAGGLHARGIGAEAVQEALEAASEGGWLRQVQRPERLRPRALVDRRRAAACWGRVRSDPAGEGAHLWVAGDNLAGAGGAVPVAAAGWLWEQGLFRGQA